MAVSPQASAPRIAVLLNRNARGLRHPTPVLRALSRFERCELIETRTLDELEDRVRELHSRAPTMIVLAGGDGSVMAGLSAVTRAWNGAPLPRFGILPAGTVSTIARNLGLPSRGAEYGKRLVGGALNGHTRFVQHPTLRVRDARGGDRVGFIFGTGLVAQFFELYDALPDAGALPAAGLVAKLFVGSFVKSQLAERVLSPMPLTVTCEDEPLAHRRYSLVVSSVLRDLGLHLRPTFRAGQHEGRLHLVASTRGAMNLALQLPVVIAGKQLVGSGHVDAVVKSFRVTFDGDLHSYVLDGDRIEASTPTESWVSVEPGPTIDLAR